MWSSFGLIVALSCSLVFVGGVQGREEAGCSASWLGWAGIKHMFTFGDSYTQTGFSVSGIQPSPGNPMGNPPYPGWTSCNGPNWVGFLTTQYNASTLLQYNLADGGATIDAALAKPYTSKVRSLIDQVNQVYLPIYSKKPKTAKWEAEDTLFAFAIGINDVLNTYWDADGKRVEKIFERLEGLVEQVYATGARNFLFLNVPPAQRSPLIISGPPQGIPLAESAIKSWNRDLLSLSAKMMKRHPDVTSLVFDTYTTYTAVLDNPLSYRQTAGLKDTTGFCAAYSNGGPAAKEVRPAQGCKFVADQYFWLNNLHPTWLVHKVVAEELGRFLGGKNSGVCVGKT